MKKEKGNQDIVTVAFFFVSSVRAGATGIEPAISALTGPHVSHYTTPPNNLNIIITRILSSTHFITSVIIFSTYELGFPAFTRYPYRPFPDRNRVGWVGSNPHQYCPNIGTALVVLFLSFSKPYRDQHAGI